MTNYYKLVVFISAFIHHILFWSLVLTPILCLMYQPWYITITLATVVIRIGTSRDRCVLTDLEDYYREKANMTLLNGKFIKHYYGRFFNGYL